MGTLYKVLSNLIFQKIRFCHGVKGSFIYIDKIFDYPICTYPISIEPILYNYLNDLTLSAKKMHKIK